MKSFKKYINEVCSKYQGIAKGKSLSDIAKKHKVSVEDIKKQIDKGSKVELEHTKDHKLATKIATDHVWENPKYYDKLKQVEEDLTNPPIIIPTNVVGNGQIAGITPGEVPPVRIKKRKSIKLFKQFMFKNIAKR